MLEWSWDGIARELRHGALAAALFVAIAANLELSRASAAPHRDSCGARSSGDVTDVETTAAAGLPAPGATIDRNACSAEAGAFTANPMP